MSEENTEVLSKPPDPVRHWRLLRAMTVLSFAAAVFGFPAGLAFFPVLAGITTPFYFFCFGVLVMWATGETVDNRVLPIFSKG